MIRLVLRRLALPALLLLLPLAASAEDRQRHFSAAPKKLGVCVSFETKKAFPELQLVLDSSKVLMLRAISGKGDSPYFWKIEFRDAGGGSDVILQNFDAEAAEIDRLWRMVESCAERS
jgi:hypothetical protein